MKDQVTPEQLGAVEKKVDALGMRMDVRFEGIDAGFDDIDAAFMQVADAFAEQRQYTEFAFGRLRDEMREGFQRVDARFVRLESRFDGLEGRSDISDGRLARIRAQARSVHRHAVEGQRSRGAAAAAAGAARVGPSGVWLG